MPDGTLTDVPNTKRTGEISVALTDSERFDLGLVLYRKNLTAYACSLTRDIDAADDLVQDTMSRALVNREKFDTTSNLRAWLFTILKNLFLSKLRRGQREVELTDAMMSGPLFATSGGQEEALLLKELAKQVGDLPPHQRNAIVFVGALGYSVNEVSRREDCPPGTVKSRVSRAREKLAPHFS